MEEKSVRQFCEDLVRNDLSQDEMRSEIVKQTVRIGVNQLDLRQIELALQYRLVEELVDINKNMENLIAVMPSE